MSVFQKITKLSKEELQEAIDSGRFQGAVNLLTAELHQGSATQEFKDKYDNVGRFPFISMSTDQFMWMLERVLPLFESIKGRPAQSFMDLGCGIGNILALARHCGLNVAGVEIDEKYIEICNDILPERSIIQADLLHWIPEIETDIYYFFRPFSSEILWIRFMAHFTQRFPNGQIFISPLGMENFTFPTSRVFNPNIVLLDEEAHIYQIQK